MHGTGEVQLLEAHENVRSPLVHSLVRLVFCESRAQEAVLIFGPFCQLSGGSESSRSRSGVTGGRISAWPSSSQSKVYNH